MNYTPPLAIPWSPTFIFWAGCTLTQSALLSPSTTGFSQLFLGSSCWSDSPRSSDSTIWISYATLIYLIFSVIGQPFFCLLWVLIFFFTSVGFTFYALQLCADGSNLAKISISIWFVSLFEADTYLHWDCWWVGFSLEDWLPITYSCGWWLRLILSKVQSSPAVLSLAIQSNLIRTASESSLP